VGCGPGSSDLTGPSSTPTAAVPGNAVLQGTIDGAVGASSGVHSSNTRHSGMKVSVVGTSLSATVDSEGQFVLAGLPSGKVTLRFEGEGVDAKLEVSGLVDGLVLTVTLAVEGGSAHVLSSPAPKPYCDYRFSGVIESISGSRLQVSGQQVEAGETKKIWKGDYRATLAELKVGDKLSVAGQLLGGGVIQAYEISAEGPKLEGKGWSFKGTVDSVSPLKVSGIKIRTDGNTRFKWSDGTALDPSQIKVGDKAYVEGMKLADGTMQAGKVMVDCR
jgi:hypothetical protein